jgi:2-oxoisovalerate dehydrogenase E1 component
MLHRDVFGKGPPVVLLHGWAANRRVFGDLARHLAPRYQVHRIDLPGHGASAKTDSAITARSVARQVQAVAPDNAVWVGWSLGGLVALATACQIPIRGLVMVAAHPRFIRGNDWPHAMDPSTIQGFANRLREAYSDTLWEYLSLQFPGAGHDDPRIAALHQVQASEPPSAQGISAGERILLESDLLSASSRVTIPSLLITGSLDSMVPPDIASTWSAHWPQLQTHTISGAAHSPFNSHPDEFQDVLEQFLLNVTRKRTRPESRQMDEKHDTEGSNTALSSDELLGFYKTMTRVRRFDQRVAELFDAGEIKGTAHSYVGQEAVATGVCANLGPADYVASNHRGHGHCIAKGARIDLMMAELMGRDTGYCRGLGGSMHIADLELGILGANGIVGAAMPLACGAALAARLRGDGSVAIAFFGDGASNQGVFHESLNLAAVWKLPIVFVCENNQYALTTSYRNTTSVERVADRAASYSIPGVRVDGNDVGEVYHVAREAIARARAGGGPTLIEALTYRWGQHSMRANLQDPRPRSEYDDWMIRDPLKRIAGAISSNDGDTAVQDIDTQVEEELEAAVSFARDGMEAMADTMLGAVYAPHAVYPPPPPAGDRSLSFPQALNEALRQEMARDESVFLMGEDVGETGGIFTVSSGLMKEFGEERVRDTPISEATFVGAGVGAAIAGMRPVVEIQIFDFIALTMDMMTNQAAKFRYMLGGKNTVPLVVRGPQGGGVRLAAQHSQSLEAWFTHIPGLVVVAPSTPYDAKGLLVSAIRDDNPVVFCEAKLSYMVDHGPVPEELYAIPIGVADVKREGTDVTVIATMAMVPRTLAAAQILARDGIEVEVIDPRTLRPLDEETILDSVRKTSRALIVHEAWVSGGFGAEVSALIADKAFTDLDAPVRRLGALDVPMPYNDELERMVIPSVERIAEAVRELAGY